MKIENSFGALKFPAEFNKDMVAMFKTLAALNNKAEIPKHDKVCFALQEIMMTYIKNSVITTAGKITGHSFDGLRSEKVKEVFIELIKEHLPLISKKVKELILEDEINKKKEYYDTR